MRRSYEFRDFPADRVAAAKRGRVVSVCLPARDEESTVGATVESLRRDLMERHPVVDEIIVVDDHSTDSTAQAAAAAGARVVSTGEILAEYAAGPGKGQAMWKAVHEAAGDVVVFCDADIIDFDTGFVLGLLGPLLTREDVTFVKGRYERPVAGRPEHGGRVTELMARPLIAVLFPHLADLDQPLSGEFAAKREVLESIPFVDGYGVDLGLLIDVTERYGNTGLVQCDLGERIHRNRPLSQLGPQSLAILQTALQRSGRSDAEVGDFGWTIRMSRPGLDPAVVTFSELPSLITVASHRKTA